MSRKKIRTKEVCAECGGVMEPADDTVLVCTSCGHSVDIDDYDAEIRYTSHYLNTKANPPRGCAACGGPYPYCKTSCVIFDD